MPSSPEYVRRDLARERYGRLCRAPVPRAGLEDEIPVMDGVRKGLRAGYPRLEGYDGETWMRGAWPAKARASRSSLRYSRATTPRALHIHTKVFTN
ncbi:hypothetical protein FIBSPDRAFT_858320 [Athelia psychrophila]|uniref:Uncharacterized protein n=1 Tax=Athelia psychrophila TaxID=1759441 RepID=A0A166LWZ4_9AGAM|nr:hypothetical protein FIBSPDRAFT_858320 [Fibularhizoctonia sp. CBS 109695]